MSDTYEYKMINVSTEPSPDRYGLRKATIESTANRWAEMGWRTVAVLSSPEVGFADSVLIERKIESPEFVDPKTSPFRIPEGSNE